MSARQPVEGKTRFGVVSVYFGMAALLAAIGFTEVERLRGTTSGYLLRWMDRMGWVSPPPPGRSPEWRPLGLLDISDHRVLQWTLVYSVCFAIWAMLMALLAEHEREESSSPSLGFILGALALHVHGFEYGMSALVAGGAALAFIRRGETAQSTIADSPE